MSAMDRKLRRRLRKRQMRVIEGGGREAAQQITEAGSEAPAQFTPSERFDLSLGAFLREYLRLERARPAEDRIVEEGLIGIMYKFLAGLCIAREITCDEFVEAAGSVYEEQWDLYERKPGDDGA